MEEQDEEDPYSEEERDGNDGQENRDAREEVVHIPGQSSDERKREEAEDNEEEDENEDELEEEEREVDDWHDDRMMDGDEGGMSLAGQAEENMSEQTDFESFKRVSFFIAEIKNHFIFIITSIYFSVLATCLWKFELNYI